VLRGGKGKPGTEQTQNEVCVYGETVLEGKTTAACFSFAGTKSSYPVHCPHHSRSCPSPWITYSGKTRL